MQMLRNIMLFLVYIMSLSMCYAQKNRIFQHKDIKKILLKHQTVAILPFRVSIERGEKRSDDSTEHTLRGEAQRESYNIPLTGTFLWVHYKKENAPALQSWDKTQDILASIAYKPIESILTDSLRKIAKALKVDALIFGIVNMYEDKYTTNFGRTQFASEEIVSIHCSIYDGETGVLIWQNEDSTAYSLRLEERVSLGKNTEIILARIFERLPYFKGKQKKK